MYELKCIGYHYEIWCGNIFYESYDLNEYKQALEDLEMLNN